MSAGAGLLSDLGLEETEQAGEPEVHMWVRMCCTSHVMMRRGGPLGAHDVTSRHSQ